MKSIPYGKQYITDADIEAVIKVLKSDYLTQGPLINNFENTFKEKVGSQFSVAVANGTAALHLAIKALGIKHGEKVITTPITFTASANCALYEGALVEFCDIDEKTFCINYESVKEKLETSPEGTYKGIIVVDFAGFPVNTEKFRSLCDKHGLWLLEDACHAPGAWYINSKGEKILSGSCHYADMAVFSFHPVKHIACGEGGMITTNNKSLFDQLNILRTHGITKQTNNIIQNHVDEGWYYEMVELGYNYRLSDIHAALGLSQLKNLGKNIEKRNEIVKKYMDEFADLPISFQQPEIGNAYHLCVIQTEKRKELYNYLVRENIFPQVHYIPVYKLPYYAKSLPSSFELKNAENYYKKCLSLPLYYSLSEAELQYVIDKIKQFYNLKQ